MLSHQAMRPLSITTASLAETSAQKAGEGYGGEAELGSGPAVDDQYNGPL
jgi:hypothetical protein